MCIYKEYLLIEERDHSRSITAAAPCPVPIHIEITPILPPVRFNSERRVPTMRAPVIPRGCPRAMAPPLGFNFLRSIPSFSTQYVA